MGQKILYGDYSSLRAGMYPLSGGSGVNKMHGLIFVTWEKYLSGRVSETVLHNYKSALKGKITGPLLSSRVYDDALLLAAVTAPSQASPIPAQTLLREYARYFITNFFTRPLPPSLLTLVTPPP